MLAKATGGAARRDPLTSGRYANLPCQTEINWSGQTGCDQMLKPWADAQAMKQCSGSPGVSRQTDRGRFFHLSGAKHAAR